ncbi:MAG: zinc ribbon domain-containing protein, partial [Candidatus Aenigmatarchaeota archaeon]
DGMFWDKKCKNCGNKVDRKWIFCPYCSSPLKEIKEKDIFQEVDKEFRQIDKMVEAKIPKFILKPPLKAKGFGITITMDNISPPKINVRTYGEPKHHSKYEEKPVRVPKVTEEPETKIQRIQNKQIITLNLPDVKNLDDIEIRQLQQSIEIKAFAGDKAYFKLIPVPSNATINNEFKDGVLKIEIVK